MDSTEDCSWLKHPLSVDLNSQGMELDSKECIAVKPDLLQVGQWACLAMTHWRHLQCMPLA